MCACSISSIFIPICDRSHFHGNPGLLPSLSLRPSGFSPFSVLPQPSLDDAGYQSIWNPLSERKPEIALRTCVPGQIFDQRGIPTNRWVETDVLLEGGEMHKIPFACGERRHSIANPLRRIRRRLLHQGANFLKNGSNLRRTTRDVLVNVFWYFSLGFHIPSPLPRTSSAAKF